MMMNKCDFALNERVQLNLKSGYTFTGLIVGLNDDHLILFDKFHMNVRILYEDISFFKEMS